MPRRPQAATGIRNLTENLDRKDVLAASGRRAVEEGGMPISTNRTNFKRRLRCRSEPDHDNADCHDHERHDRVNYNAERAMISITADRMHMRHLGHGQKRQQDQAHNSCNPKGAWL
jgi:hypothetical protein